MARRIVWVLLAVSAGFAGLSVTYYVGADAAQARAVAGRPSSAIVPAVDFDWGLGKPDAVPGPDAWSARFAGAVEAPVAGVFEFRATGDGGVRLWVDGLLLIDRWHDQRATAYPGTIRLEAGRRYGIRLDYYENTGEASVRLEWRPPGRPGFEVVPRQYLYSTVRDFPADVGYVDIKARYGAKGDGVADGTT